MRNTKKLLALVLAFVMVLGLLPAASAQTVHTHGIEEYPELELNVETTAFISAGETVYFRFTPAVTAEYTFKSLTSDNYYDPQGYLYDADMNLLASHADNSYIDFDFTIVYTLEAGKTYVYACHLYDNYKQGDVTFLLTGVMPPEHNYVGVVTKEPTCTEDGLMTYTCSDCGDSYTEVIPAGHDFVDGWCSRCGEEQIFTGTCGDALTWKLNASGTLTISGNGEMYNYLPYEPLAPWADHIANIKNVVIEEGAVSIGDFAFYNCTALETVTLPQSLTTVGQSAFRGCSALTTVTGGENVTNVSNFAYMDCANLTNVTLTGAKTIGNSAFYRCYALESVEFSDSLTAIDTMAFSECTALTEVSLPDTVTELGSDVFCGCTALTSAKLSHNMVSVPTNTFAYCESLTDVTLPRYMTSVGNGAFFGCSSLETLSLPFSTITIGDDAFGNCTALTNFDLPMAVTYVGFFAFYNCQSLKSITFPAGMTYFTGGSFSHCTGLTEITFPADTIQVDDQAFEFCTNLKTINFTGDAPAILSAFEGVVADAYYPAGNNTWTPDLLLDYGGTLTWHAKCSNHRFGKWTPVTQSTCVEHGIDERKCDLCGWTETREAELAPHSWDKGVVQDGMMLFTCTVCGATELREIAGPVNPFTDVTEIDFFYDAVLWAVENGVTTGTSDTTFSPNAACNRAAVVTFLWRAAGSPEPESTEHPFEDVVAGSFYEKAVLWAVENNITNGTDETHFSPTGTCNRAQAVTFLYRAQGEPAFTAAECPFSDVVAGEWYVAPILWAVENGITNGMGDGTFGVGTTCNRAQVVTFLYRTYNK